LSVIALHRRTAIAPRDDSVAERPVIHLRGVSKVFGQGPDALLAVDRIDLAVRPSEFVCVLGASGCGKSTLLSLIAGLEKPTVGTVEVAHRQTSLMFQEPALLPWLTVERNVDLPMRLHHVPAAERRDEVDRLLGLVHLQQFARRRPHELSGGMRQRVALARALAQRADVLLMDEPFAALDAITRDVLHDDLTRIWEQTAVSVVFVTHNVREAVRLGDRVILMGSRPGRVVLEIDVDIPRPRRTDDASVATLAATIIDRLREEISVHGRP